MAIIVGVENIEEINLKNNFLNYSQTHDMTSCVGGFSCQALFRLATTL